MYYFTKENLHHLEKIKALLVNEAEKKFYCLDKWGVDKHDAYYSLVTTLKLILLAKLYRGEFPSIYAADPEALMPLFERIKLYLTPSLFLNTFEEAMIAFIKFDVAEINLCEQDLKIARNLNEASSKKLQLASAQALRYLELKAHRVLLSIYRESYSHTCIVKLFDRESMQVLVCPFLKNSHAEQGTYANSPNKPN